MKFNFKDGAVAEIGTEDPWYALTDGGYLKPEDVLEEGRQIKKVVDAISVVKAFIDQCYENEVIFDS